MGSLSESFDYSEFVCKCGKCDGGVPPSAELVARLQGVRNLIGRSVLISSGVRCMDRDLELAPTPERRAAKLANPGEHVRGMAADVVAITARDRFHVLKAAFEAGFRRIGINAQRGFIHLGVDVTHHDADVVWQY